MGFGRSKMQHSAPAEWRDDFGRLRRAKSIKSKGVPMKCLHFMGNRVTGVEPAVVTHCVLTTAKRPGIE